MGLYRGVSMVYCMVYYGILVYCCFSDICKYILFYANMQMLLWYIGVLGVFCGGEWGKY